jgi:[protein-PII] uridylyltransferase
MNVRTTLRDEVIAARQRLKDGRDKLAAQHMAGSPGIQVSTALTDLVDGIVLELYSVALAAESEPEGRDELALVALGGYARRDLAPYSDVDLMLLHHPNCQKSAVAVARRLNQDIVDAGLTLGFSLRTPQQAFSLSWRDAEIFTSLAEARCLTGNVPLFSRFFQYFRQGAMRRHTRLIDAVARARAEEQAKFGDTGYVLRPNVKRSRGALRDVHMMRWLGFARYGQADLEQLEQLGVLPTDDYRRVRKAYHYLLRLRNELHFMFQKSHDTLDRSAQLRIAERWGYQAGPGLLPVEALMREYFEHTSDIRYDAALFLDSVRDRVPTTGLLERALAKRVGEDLRIGRRRIWIPAERLPQAAGNLTTVLQLIDQAGRLGRRIDHTTWQAIRTAMRQRPEGPPDAAARERFLQILDDPRGLGQKLRRLHELRVLEQFIPGMKHARCLLQFNEYHKYTVDAHTLRAVDEATSLGKRSDLVGRLYRDWKDKCHLHLALLLHDLGKGYPEDHSIVGAKLAEETAAWLQLPAAEGDRLAWLVRQHLLMIETAMRHDLNDAQILLRFITEVGSPERLDLLLMHTVADLLAVGPDVLSDWKMHLLTQIYARSASYFREGRLLEASDPELEARRNLVRKSIKDEPSAELLQRCLNGLTDSYIRDRTADALIRELREWGATLGQGRRGKAWGQFDPVQATVEYTIVSRQEGRPVGTFARMTGALSSLGQEILRSDIQTVGDNIAWNRFWVIDGEGTPVVPQRIDEICRLLEHALEAESTTMPQFRRVWRPAASDRAEQLAPVPAQVHIDNQTSDRYTILSVFMYDRPGLLFDLAMVLVDLQFVLQFAKIGTYLDQVVDVFYITELDGSKLQDPTRQAELRERLFAIADRRA